MILVAQNHAPRRHVGVATSAVTFARSLGGSIGVAVLGGVFAARLSSELAGASPQAARIADAGAKLDPQEVHALPPVVRADVLDAFAAALQTTFAAAAAIAVAALVATLLLPGGLRPEREVGGAGFEPA